MSTKIEVKPHPRTVFYDEHAIRLPISLVCSQVFIFLCCCTVVGLSAYSLTFNKNDNGNIFAICVALVKMAALPYLLISSLVTVAAPIYHRVIILLLLIIGVLAWAAEFINLAVQITRNNLSDLPNYNEMVAEATLGGLNFASLIFLLIGFSALFHQARTDGRTASALLGCKSKDVKS